jgi:hypothetical protein
MKDFLDIERIAFFGRTYDEYMRIFDLDVSMLSKGRILDCPAGASSFTAEARMKGFDAAACDVMYGMSADELFAKGREDLRHVFDKFDEVSHLYTWKCYKDKDEVMSLRKRALDSFAHDFSEGIAEGRYVQAELPHLPFADGTFSLVLSGHFLFLYNDRLDPAFHKACLKELVRISSGEVRIYPLTGLDTKPYPYMEDVLSFLQTEGIRSEMLDIPFEFQKGANQILKLGRKIR